MHEFVTVCERAARAGGQALLDWAGRFSIREKGPADLVTDADLASQEAIGRVVLEAYPEHGYLAEEGADLTGKEGYRWIADPLDGTTNYVHGVPQFAVSLALEQNGALLAATVFDPVSQECFTAGSGEGAYLNGRKIRASGCTDLGQALVAVSFSAKVPRNSPEISAFTEVLLTAQAVRRMGSAALNLAYVAAGRFDACWATDTKVWDVAAGILLIREAGGIVTDVSGRDLDLMRPRFLAASTSTLHATLGGILRPIVG